MSLPSADYGQAIRFDKFCPGTNRHMSLLSFFGFICRFLDGNTIAIGLRSYRPMTFAPTHRLSHSATLDTRPRVRCCRVSHVSPVRQSVAPPIWMRALGYRLTVVFRGSRFQRPSLTHAQSSSIMTRVSNSRPN